LVGGEESGRNSSPVSVLSILSILLIWPML